MGRTLTPAVFFRLQRYLRLDVYATEAAADAHA